MAEPNPPQQPQSAPPQPGRYWLFADKRVAGPYTLRLLKRIKDLRPDTLAAPAGARKETDWKPAAEFPELKAILDARSAPKPKEPAPAKKGKPAKPPLPPLPEGPNYLVWFFILVLSAAAGISLMIRAGSKPPVPRAAGAVTNEFQPPPDQMWPAPGTPAERAAAEAQVVEAYLPLLLTKKGIKAENLAPACASAREFVASHEAYKAKYGAAALEEFSQRLSVTMRADSRTKSMMECIERAGAHGMDLTSLKYAAQLRQNMQPADFSLARALESASTMLSSFCAKP